MRSEHVFSAQHKILNRFMLCQVTSKATKRLHITATRTEDTINRVLVDVGIGQFADTNSMQLKANPLGHSSHSAPVFASAIDDLVLG